MHIMNNVTCLLMPLKKHLRTWDDQTNTRKSAIKSLCFNRLQLKLTLIYFKVFVID